MPRRFGEGGPPISESEAKSTFDQLRQERLGAVIEGLQNLDETHRRYLADYISLILQELEASIEAQRLEETYVRGPKAMVRKGAGIVGRWAPGLPRPLARKLASADDLSHVPELKGAREKVGSLRTRRLSNQMFHREEYGDEIVDQAGRLVDRVLGICEEMYMQQALTAPDVLKQKTLQELQKKILQELLELVK